MPSVVEVVAYYANLLLIGSFLGLGLGLLLCGRRGLVGLFPWLLLADVLVVLGVGRVAAMPTGGGEMRLNEVDPRVLDHAALAVVFVLNTALFVPLGQRVGQLLERMPPLTGYAWDLGGSLLGTLAFGAFSFLFFSPQLGVAAVAALAPFALPRRAALVGGAGLVAALVAMVVGSPPNVVWSPYHSITVHTRPGGPAERDPPPDLRTRRDPPQALVRINRAFYQHHLTVDPRRYSPDAQPEALFTAYGLPHLVNPGPRRVLVVGSGGGTDVEAAILAGAAQVDAVDVDPGLTGLSRRWSPSGIYDDPRVALHHDDARAFLERARPVYDRVIYGRLDSQALFSSMTNLRLDGYVYTVEGFRAAWRALTPDGAMSVTFVAGGTNEWLAWKLHRMLEAATGQRPIVYVSDWELMLVASRRPLRAPPEQVGRYRLVRGEPGPADLATDDWPFLYLRGRGIPRDYALAIGLLALLSVGVVLAVGPRRRPGASEVEAFFLGAGFLLLQTKAVGDCSLFFGATWLVTTAVITGVLLMAFLANRLEARRPPGQAGRDPYFPLAAALVLVVAAPREWVLGLPFGARLAWTVLVAPLPVFFAGRAFSALFARATAPAALFGANLLGAVVGGFSEYLTMAIGSRRLSVLLLAFYAAAWAAARRGRS